MRSLKLTLGIVSFFMAFLVMLYLCVMLVESGIGAYGYFDFSAIILMAVYALVAGVIVILTADEERNTVFLSAAFYIAGGILGLALMRDFNSITVWAAAYIVCGIIFIISSIKAHE